MPPGNWWASEMSTVKAWSAGENFQDSDNRGCLVSVSSITQQVMVYTF